MMKRLLVIAALLALAHDGPAQPAPAEPQVPVFLLKQGSCGEYIEARRLPPGGPEQVRLNAVAAYTWGVLSAYNVYHGKPYIPSTAAPAATVWAYLDKFCRDNPLAETAHGAFVLAHDMPKEP
jgi:hypothetical protein